MIMIQQVIKAIEEQQKGKENTAVYMVGEQLKDICRDNPNAAELVIQDLRNEEMSIDKCEKQIKKYADSHKKGNFACVPPDAAEKIICEFYGIHNTETAAESESGIVSLMDLL